MIPLEDQFQDVVSKARRGLRLTESSLARKAEVSPESVEAFQEGGAALAGESAGKIAAALGLDLASLRELERGEWHPGEVTLPATSAAFNVPFGSDMTVNFYLAWDREGGQAAAFDTGLDCGALLQTLRAHDLKLDGIFLTHTHEDHVADLGRLVAETGAEVYVSELENFPGATPISDGETFTVGGLTITARLTAGHSRGGMTYVVTGAVPMLAVVGDALFAASMGGVGPERYQEALVANRAQIFSLLDTAVILPGHGPATTVGAEKTHNPFYATPA